VCVDVGRSVSRSFVGHVVVVFVYGSSWGIPSLLGSEGCVWAFSLRGLGTSLAVTPTRGHKLCLAKIT